MADARKTREAWLVRGIRKLESVFKRAGYEIPENLRVSVGFPKGVRGGKNGKAIGQCWTQKVSADGTYEMFISPELDEPVRVLDVLTHEIVHAVVGIEAGHKKPFRDCAVSVGLEGKMTATVAGEELKAELTKVSEVLGDYPHAKLNPMDGAKKKGSRLLKFVCPECGAVVRISRTVSETANLACVHGEKVFFLVEE